MRNNVGTSITTKVGDKGKTALFSGEIVDKDSPRTDAYGDVDELVSVLGLARAFSEKTDVTELITWVQVELFTVAAEMATDKNKLHTLKERIDEDRLDQFEEKREALESKIKMPAGFILPGGTKAAAFIDHARTISRRCERKAVALSRYGLIENPEMIIWLNRLSDFLWLLARYDEGDKTALKP